MRYGLSVISYRPTNGSIKYDCVTFGDDDISEPTFQFVVDDIKKVRKIFVVVKVNRCQMIRSNVYTYTSHITVLANVDECLFATRVDLQIDGTTETIPEDCLQGCAIFQHNKDVILLTV